MRTKLQQLRSIYNSKGVNKTAKLHKFSPRQSTATVAEVKDTQLEKAAQSEPLVSTVVSSSDVEDTLDLKTQDESPIGGKTSTSDNAEGVSAKSLTGCSLDEVIVLEIFAGTGRLTRAIRDLGMSAMAVDKDKSRAQSVHVACYDLNEPDQLLALCDFINETPRKDSLGAFCAVMWHCLKGKGPPASQIGKAWSEGTKTAAK